MDAVDYNETIFQKENSLFNQVINKKTYQYLDQEGCLDIKYTAFNEYHMHFIFMHVPYNVAIKSKGTSK